MRNVSDKICRDNQK